MFVVSVLVLFSIVLLNWSNSCCYVEISGQRETFLTCCLENKPVYGKTRSVLNPNWFFWVAGGIQTRRHRMEIHRLWSRPPTLYQPDRKTGEYPAGQVSCCVLVQKLLSLKQFHSAIQLPHWLLAYAQCDFVFQIYSRAVVFHRFWPVEQ